MRPPALRLVLFCWASLSAHGVAAQANHFAWRTQIEHEGIARVTPMAITAWNDGAMLFGHTTPPYSWFVGTIVRFGVDGTGKRQWTRSGSSIPFMPVQVHADALGAVAFGQLLGAGFGPAVIAYDNDGNERWTWSFEVLADQAPSFLVPRCWQTARWSRGGSGPVLVA